MNSSEFSASAFRRRAETGLRRDWPDDAFDPLALSRHGDHALNEVLPEEATLVPAPARPAAVLAAVVARAEGATLLLTQRSSALREHSGQIAFPGGKIEPGEAPLDAALREAEEEIGLDRARVEVLGCLDPYQTGTGFRVFPVVGLVRPPFDLKLDAREVEDVFETPLAFLMNPAHHRKEKRVWKGRERQFYVMPWENRYIWGATAGMIRNLYERLYR